MDEATRSAARKQPPDRPTPVLRAGDRTPESPSSQSGVTENKAPNRETWKPAMTMRMTEMMSLDVQNTKVVIEKFLQKALIDIDPEIAIVSKNACSGDLIVMKTDGSWLTIKIEKA
jgi:hypothetical protein